MTRVPDFEPALHILAYKDITEADLDRVAAQVDEIFFASSSVQSFASEEERAAFRWRWLDRYLVEEPEHAFVALIPGPGAVGYLVGSLADPAQREAFAALGYFQHFADLTRQYPAHLHVNVAESMRSRGVGASLVEAFCGHARQHGAPGVHIVTGEGMRNVQFYTRLGFATVGRAPHKGGHVVMLARRL